MKTRLTLFQATSIVVGAGVGGGVMAVPYLASRSGALVFIPIVVVALALNVVLNLLLTEVLVRDGRDLQIVELMREYVFRGRIGAAVSWAFFLVLGLSFVASLTAYASGAGEVIATLTGIPSFWARLAVYFFCAGVVFFGLRSVGLFEGGGIVILGTFALLVLAGSLGNWDLGRRLVPAAASSWNAPLALFGVVMYSLNAAFAVPQAVKGLGREPRRSAAAVVGGAAINAVFVVLVTLVALAVSPEVTEVAVTGIGDGTSRFIAVAGSLFVLFAMMTTYWSVSLALADIVRERTGWDGRLSWLAATVPTLILIVFGLFGFVEYMQIAGGIVALVVVYVTVPMYLRARRERRLPAGATWRFSWIAAPAVLALFVAGMVLMAVGSFMGVAGG